MTDVIPLLQHHPIRGWLFIDGSWSGVRNHCHLLKDVLLEPTWHEMLLAFTAMDQLKKTARQWLDELLQRTNLQPRTASTLGAFIEAVRSRAGDVLLMVVGTSPECNVGITLPGETHDAVAARAASSAVVAAGSRAAFSGDDIAAPSGGAFPPGLGLLDEAMIDPSVLHADSFSLAENCLCEWPGSYVLGLPHNAVIAFGPEGQIRLGGEPPPKMVVESGWVEGI